MTDDKDQTDKRLTEFDYSNPATDLVYHERRDKADRRDRAPAKEPEKPAAAAPPPAPSERRAKKERRRRIDPTTFEKQYSDDEMEFMNAMQRFKEQSGKQFPTYREVIRVLVRLGYRRELKEPELAELTLDGANDLPNVAMSLADSN